MFYLSYITLLTSPCTLVVVVSCNNVVNAVGGVFISGKERLQERIIMLSTPRDYRAENLADGLVASLPPEGN